MNEFALGGGNGELGDCPKGDSSKVGSELGLVVGIEGLNLVLLELLGTVSKD